MTGQEDETFGDLLRRLRLEAGLTQEELAERAGLSVRGISDLERGVNRAPFRSTLRRLIEALNLRDEQAALLQGRAARRRGARDQAPGPASYDIPRPPTPILGRERDIAMILHLLHQEGFRLVTVTGTGGVGKTRVAIEVACRVDREYADGIAFVSLAPLTNPALVPVTLAASLGLTASPTLSPEHSLKRFLADREMLVVLDNLEQIVEAAPFLADLLVGCPTLKLLVTSRTPLHLRGEQQIEIDPLPVGDVGSTARNPAVELFLQRARAVRSIVPVEEMRMDDVAEICRRLDGIPLAIELAAAQVRYVSPGTLLEQMAEPMPLLQGGPRDLPARQRTMGDTIAWSYHLLDEDEQALFRALSVFAGGASEEAIKAVWENVRGTATSVRDLLRSLLDASVLQVKAAEDGTLRYQMFETIRQFAANELEATGEAHRARAEHAQWVGALAMAAEPHLTTEKQAVWSARLDLELDNIRAALTWCIESHEADLGLRIVASIWRLWFNIALTEGRMWTKRALALSESQDVPLDVRGAALHAAGALAYHQGDYADARQMWDESLAIARRRRDDGATATALNGLGVLATETGEYRRARDLLEVSAAIRRRLHDVYGLGATLTNLGIALLYEGNLVAAREFQVESLSLYQQIGSTVAIGNSLTNLSIIASQQGDYALAEDLARESLAIGRVHNLPGAMARALTLLGSLAIEHGDPGGARVYLEEARAHCETVEVPGELATVLVTLATVSRTEGNTGEAADLAQRALALSRSIGDDRGAVSALLALGDVARQEARVAEAMIHYQDTVARATRLRYMYGIALGLERVVWLATSWGPAESMVVMAAAAAAARDGMGAQLPLMDRGDHEASMAELRRRLPPEQFSDAWQRGHAMALETALTLADTLSVALTGPL